MSRGGGAPARDQLGPEAQGGLRHRRLRVVLEDAGPALLAEAAPLLVRNGQEAVEGLDGEMEVLVDPADVALAEKTFSDMGLSPTIKGELPTAGGLVVLTQGGKVMRRNTFEERLDKVRQLIQADVAEILFV